MNEPINILGEEIDPENFPALYQWAKVNKSYLEEVIKRTSEANNESISSTLVHMEMEYGR